jgi:uncharacterized membrane protein
LRVDVGRLAISSLLALALAELLWETVLAPLRSGGSWLALKALPLAWLLARMHRGSSRARQGLLLLLPFYLAEAVVRGLTETGRRGLVATVVAMLAGVTFVALLAWIRGERGQKS